jgi:hypothetical protein
MFQTFGYVGCTRHRKSVLLQYFAQRNAHISSSSTSRILIGAIAHLFVGFTAPHPTDEHFTSKTGCPVCFAQTRQFYKQLKLEFKYEYDGRKMAVWDRRLVDGEQFQVAPGYNAAILPFLAKEERYTVTIFIRLTTN